MSILEYFRNKRLNRLERDLKMLRNRIAFNPLKSFEDNNLLDYTNRVEEYRIWYQGVSSQLRQLYKSNYVNVENINYFWKRALPNIRMCHTGLPGLISRKMATVIFGSGYKVKSIVYNDGKSSEDKVKTTAIQELVDNLRTLCKIDECCENAAQVASWSGHVIFKFSHKISLTPYPIVEIASVENAEVVKERGLTKAIIFKYFYKKKTVNYRLDEIYTTNDIGDACINYELYKLDHNKEAQVELSELEQTKDLKDFTYNGVKGMLAFDIPNLYPSHEFPDSPYGASDYEGDIDSFDALDEIYSVIVQEARDNKTIRYYPDIMIPKDKDGEDILFADDFVTNYKMYKGDQDQDAKNKIEVVTFDDKTEDHLKKYRIYLTTAINNAGLSPIALGVTGLESVNSSADSQIERNKTTLETRARKLKIWTPFLENMYMQLLIMNSWIQRNTTAIQDGFKKVDLDLSNLKINIEFNDYINDSIEKKIDTWGSAKQQNVASTQEAISRIHPDWTPEQILSEVNLIKFEEGISLDNPLNMPNLDKLTNLNNDDKDNDDNKEDDDKKKKDEKDDSRNGE